MPQYIFTHDKRDNSFPERYRVVSLDEDAESLRDTESLTGTVLNTEAIEFLDKLMARCQTDESITAEFVDAPFWEFIVNRYNPVEAERAAKATPRKGAGGLPDLTKLSR